MGAIAAYRSNGTNPDPSLMQRMLDAVPHRGRNTVVRARGTCELGVVFDENGTDASLAEGRGLLVGVCGKIDNLDELAPTWGVPGASPAELVLAGYHRLGDDLPTILRGQFAVILTDGSIVRAFRDHVGFAPLYFREQGAELFVATEVKQILAGCGIPREPEAEFMASLLYGTHRDETLCALRGVRRLPQGSLLHAAPKGARWSRFWRPEELLETARPSPSDVQLRFDDLMTRAVGRALTPETVIALSGGIDSTALAAYAGPEHQRLYGRPLTALSAVYPDLPTIDERASVEIVARDLGFELQVYRPRARPLDGLRDFVRQCDGPAPSSFARPTELYLEARSLGFRTILSGNYAELITDVGQPYLVTHLAHRRRLAPMLELFRRERERNMSLRAIARQAARAFVPTILLGAYDRRRRLGNVGPDWLDQRRLGWWSPRQVAPLGRWCQAQVASFYMPRLAVEADEIQQASSGVAVRWPWMDVDLWEFFLRLPAEMKYPDLVPRKLFVRDLLRGKVPDQILDRQDKVVIDEAAMRRVIDYEFLRALLKDPPERIAGVDYVRLGERLRQEDLPARDFRYIRNLAAIHVFLEDARLESTDAER